MISDGDSSAYQAVKHIYATVLLKDLNRSSMDSIDENVDDSFFCHNFLQNNTKAILSRKKIASTT
jgi:hypothetical protein